MIMVLRYMLSVVPSLFVVGLAGQAFTLTHNEQLSVGSEYVMRAVQNITALDTTTGTNVIWDHTDLVATGASYDVSVLAPATSPYGSNFPASNFCIYEASVARYSYFTNTPGSFARIGYWRDQLATYSDPQTELVYPVTYGSSNSDTWANNAVSFPGTYAYTVIGAGTLRLPSATYNDVLLVRVETTNIVDFDQYVWISATNGAYLLIYNMASLFGSASAQMTTSTGVGIDERTDALELRVHAAANGILPVTYRSAKSLTYRISDVAGRTLATGFLAAAAQPSTALLDVAMLRAGVHILELGNDQERRAMRFWIQ